MRTQEGGVVPLRRQSRGDLKPFYADCAEPSIPGGLDIRRQVGFHGVAWRRHFCPEP